MPPRFERTSLQFDTRVVRAGEEAPLSRTHAHAPPIHQTTAWEFETLAEVDAVWEGKAPGYIYRRYGGPNQAALEAAIASLEDAPDALALASGLGATLTAVLAHLRPGDQIVATAHIYGGTQRLFVERLAPLGIETRFVNIFDPAELDRAWSPQVRAVWVETMTNPTLRVADVPALAAIARERGALLIVDNTFATPVLCRPLGHGAHLVLHSATKYLGGHDDAMGGVLAGATDLITACRTAAVDLGPTLAPFEAWLLLRGLRTLALRMQRACANALALAQRLANHPAVATVHYPGLASHPEHALAARLLQGGFGAMVSFTVRGGQRAVSQLIETLRLIPFLPTLGGLTSSVMHPATTSHRHLSDGERERLGVTAGLLRLSVGIEDLDDLWRDLDRALSVVQ